MKVDVTEQEVWVQVPRSSSSRRVPRKEIELRSDICLVNGMEDEKENDHSESRSGQGSLIEGRPLNHAFLISLNR